MEKTCKHCSSVKNLEEFPARKDYKDGRSSTCKKCLSKRSIEWARNNPEKVRLGAIKTRAKHPNTRRQAKLVARYGMTLAEFTEMSERQGNKCLICKKHELENKNSKLFVDHNHKNGKIRGLLCDRCNKCLDLMEDNIELLKSAMAYLENSG